MTLRTGSGESAQCGPTGRPRAGGAGRARPGAGRDRAASVSDSESESLRLRVGPETRGSGSVRRPRAQSETVTPPAVGFKFKLGTGKIIFVASRTIITILTSSLNQPATVTGRASGDSESRVITVTENSLAN